MESIYKEIKRKDWNLVYGPEFEQYRERYNNVVSKIKGVLEGEEVEGVEFKKINNDTKSKTEYFVLSVDDEEFFVKKTIGLNQSGVDEFKAGKIVEERLLTCGLKNVKCINYIFAYTDKGLKYTVSKYDKDAEKTLSDHIAQLRVEGKYDECTRLNTRLGEIRLNFPEYDDVRGGNMGYNSETDTIILFDLNLKSNSLIESGDHEL